MGGAVSCERGTPVRREGAIRFGMGSMGIRAVLSNGSSECFPQGVESNECFTQSVDSNEGCTHGVDSNECFTGVPRSQETAPP